ncbi:MAG: discoidin domain-containing protein [Pyrinomonadaceae bacterium]|nr:discoidin domain-containing protein [Sphingobacteriaceae bacterium]
MENSKFHSSFYSDISNVYRSTINNSYKDPEILYSRLSELKNKEYTVRKVFDPEILDERSLNANATQAIKTFEKGRWRKNVSDFTFNNFILPYRCDDENINHFDWRGYFLTKYIKDNGDSIFDKDIEQVAKNVHKWLSYKKKDFTVKFGTRDLQLPPLDIHTVDKLQMGSCRDIAKFSIATFRAIGIPSAMDFTPMYLNLDSGHEWCAVISDSTSCIPVDIKNEKLGNYKFPSFLVSKVYRKAFQPTVYNHLRLKGLCNYLPEFLNNPFLIDVTSSYFQTTNVAITIKDIPVGAKVAYLAVFAKVGWYPIAYGEIKDHSVVFPNIALNKGVYLPVTIEKSGQTILDDPFFLTESGQIREITLDKASVETVELTRKYPTNLSPILTHMSSIVGGIFQFANKKDFSDAITVHRIKSPPGFHYEEVNISNFKRYRYARYKASRGCPGNMAELEFYGNKVKLAGEIIGTSGSWRNSSEKVKEVAFDGNPLTFFESAHPDNNWIGLRFSQPQKITKIKFLSRNDLNSIYESNSYELFYWDNDWISLGTKVANGKSIRYSNVPKGALLWLRSDSGSEERIFTYNGGKQIWW